MSTHKAIDRLCCAALALALVLTVLLMNAEALGIQKVSAAIAYESALFDTSKVHSIEIFMDDWDAFLETCQEEEYASCTVVIDNEACKNVAIRAKGNTSLTQVAAYGNDRYSFKVEFDHYDSANTYRGLDKLCLNNIIQDNTYMKDYLCYQWMAQMGVAAPLCSYVFLTVNGEAWGLYLAVEGVEESFLQRNYGSSYGELYKPDSQNMGGGRGNGQGFDMEEFFADENWHTDGAQDSGDISQMPDGMGAGGFGGIGNGMTPPDGMPENGNMQNAMVEGMTPPDGTVMQEEMTPPDGGNMLQSGSAQELERPESSGMMNSSDDVLLNYIDDSFDSYSNIFDNAKTDVSDTDKARLIAALKRLSDGESLEETVDMEAVLNYFVVHNFVLNFDSYTGSMIHNYYLYEEDGCMQMIPWDYNLAFGTFVSDSSATSLVNYPIDSPVSGGSVEDRPMLAWIFSNAEYTERYHQLFSQFIDQTFADGKFERMIDDLFGMLAPYVQQDPTKFCTYEAFETGVSTLKSFCLLRAESVSGQLNGVIGSTADAQVSADLINANELNIRDMGTMNGGVEANGADTSRGEGTAPDLPDGSRENAQMPNFGGPFSNENGMQKPSNSAEQEFSSQLLLLGVSVAVLLVGLTFALLYRRRCR